MLVDPRRLIALIIVVFAVAAASIVAATADLDAMRRSLPSIGGDEPYAVRVEAFSARGAVTGEAMLAINEARVEHQVTAAIRGVSGSGPVSRAPRSLASMRSAPGAAGLRRALDGIPRRELSVEAFVRRPLEPLDPWRVEVLVDVRPIAGDAPSFATPTSEVAFEVRPYGEAGAGIVDRWHVDRIEVERGGLLGLSRDIVYVRRGNVGVVAATEERELAEHVAAMAASLQPDLRRRYRPLADTNAAYIALVPTRAHVARVFDERAMPAEAIGTAYDGTNIALLVPSFEWDPEFVQRDLIRHELTHLATDRLTRSWAHGVYVEGLAEWEGNHEVTATGIFYINNHSAVAAVESGKVDLDAVLFDAGSFEELDGSMGYRLGMLTADYIEREYGHRRAVRFYAMLGDGVEARVAVRRALRTSPAAFREGVRGWMSSHREWVG